MELKGMKVKEIIYPYGEYILGSVAEVIDEGSFYRIDGTHIFDKHRIENVNMDGDKVTIKMTDKTVILGILP